MKLVTCNRCQSQFNVEGFTPGSTFVCGKCRNVLTVPVPAVPVMQPIQTAQPVQPKRAAPPPTVALSPEDMKKALAAAQGSAPSPGGSSAPAKPKLPAAMEARKQAPTQQRAGGAPPPTVALSPEDMKKALAAAGMGRSPASTAPAAPAAPPPQNRAPGGAPPPVTVALSPEEMRKALAQAQSASAPSAPAAMPPAASRAAAARTAPAPAAPAPAAPAAPAPRTARPARGGDDDAPPAKSRTGLMIGIGIGVLALGGAAIALSGGKDDKKDGGSATPAPVENLDEWGKWLKLPRADQDADIAKRIGEAGTDQAKLQAVHAWLQSEKVKGNGAAYANSTTVLDAALRADPSAEWARTAKGEKKVAEMLAKVQAECPNAWKNPDADEKTLRAAAEKAATDPWVTAQEFAKLEVIAERVRKRENDLASNPRRQAFEKKKNWTRDNPLFADMKWIYVENDPYLISQQYVEITDPAEAHKAKEREKKAKWVAEMDAIVFKETYRQFLALFGERYKLPKLEDTGRVLHAIITWNRESFDEVYRKNNPGSEITGGIRAFYAPGEQRIFHYLGEDAMRSQDEFKVANGRIHKEAYQVAAHEETHQLQHEYGAIVKGGPLRDDQLVLRNRTLMWFEEGLAEFMGTFEIDATKKDDLAKATFYHNRILITRVHTVRGDAKMGSSNREMALKWTIKELLVPNNHPELMKRSGELVSGQAGAMANFFYARAWGLVHFMWYYDNGKYREGFYQYLESVLKDQQSVGSLCKALGKSSVDDLASIEAEYNWYWNELLRRPTGKKPGDSGKWFEPETEAPTGKYVEEEE